MNKRIEDAVIKVREILPYATEDKNCFECMQKFAILYPYMAECFSTKELGFENELLIHYATFTRGDDGDWYIVDPTYGQFKGLIEKQPFTYSLISSGYMSLEPNVFDYIKSFYQADNKDISDNEIIEYLRSKNIDIFDNIPKR